jgi:hypothetical protein
MKLILQVLLALIVTSLCLGTKLSQTVPSNLLYNQKVAYPDNYQAATNRTNLDTANYTSPYLSHVLFEEDPKGKLRKYEFVAQLRFQSYRLTKGEAEALFDFADADRDDLLDQEEWDTFAGLYIYPFEACDLNHDYLLDEAEFGYCFDKDPRSRFIVFRRKTYPTRHKQMMANVSSRQNSLINFHDYMFIRRSLFAWKNCQSNAKYISKTSYKCAVRTAILAKMHFNGEIDGIYDVGVTLANDMNIIQLDFINYLRSMYCLYSFVSLGSPVKMPYIEKTSFLKAVREDRVPSNFEESEVNYLFELINTNPLIPVTQMNYASFSFFWNMHRIFNKYSVSRPLLLTEKEFIKVINDEWTPAKIRFAIDVSRTGFSQAQYQEASLILQRKRPNEGKYFFSFKQDASENTAMIWNAASVNSTYYNFTSNVTNYKVFFSVFSELDKEVWTKNDYYRAFQLANLFVSMIKDWRFTVASTDFVDNLMDQYVKVDPPISYMQRQNYPLYKAFPREIYLDVITFVTIENYRTKIRAYMNSSNLNLYESFAKLVLMDFGMKNMPDTVLDLAKKGLDNLRRRTFDPHELVKNCVIVQAVAAEFQRTNEFTKKYNLLENRDFSRRFPKFPRRAQASPFV